MHVGYVDVRSPSLASVVAAASGAPQVVVPLFVSAGRHVTHDVGAAVTRASPEPSLTPHLGRLDGFADLVARHTAPGAQVVVVAAGSTRPSARAEVARLAAEVGARLGRPAQAAFLSGGGTSLTEAVDRLGDPSGTAVASLLLAPGRFDDLLQAECAALGPACPRPVLEYAAAGVADLVVAAVSRAVA